MIALFLVSSLGCGSDYEVSSNKPDGDADKMLLVDPDILDYGGVAIGTEEIETFTILNAGTTVVELDGVGMFGAAFTLLTDPAGSLDPGDEVTVDISYSPLTDADEGLAVVMSNADSPEVTLLGNILSGALVVYPSSIDFGDVQPGAPAEWEEVTVGNTGGLDMMVFAPALSGDSGFVVDPSSLLPATIAAGETLVIDVGFGPSTTGAHSGLIVFQNDLGDTATVDLAGNGLDAPIAICEVDPPEVEPLYTAVTWKGSDSYDPDGGTLSYSWSMTAQPAGSGVSLPGGSGPNRTGFYPDLAGTYTAQLVVTNDSGVSSAPCIAELEVVPAEDLWIEMYWGHGGDDMDLHLVRPSGSLESNSDCYYMNCTGGGLDWGSSGDPSDNPSLDLDDIPGIGPENINIEDPQSGTFTVYVHDYPGSSYTPANSVTVNIYVAGSLAWTDTRNISGENSYEPFAEIDWPTGAITGL